MPYPKDLDPVKIQDNLNTILIGSEVMVLDTADSTNDLAKRQLEQGSDQGLVILANAQSAGRGRFGRSWASEPDVGLYLSVLLTPPMDPDKLPQITLMAGVASVLTVNEFSRSRATLKWPNDVLINGKKICGALCEYCRTASGKTGVILGLGLNVNHRQSQFPPEIQQTATSLRIENGAPADRLAVVLSLIRHLDREYEAWLLGGVQALAGKWTDNTDMFGKQIVLTRGDSVTRGTALGLDAGGNLRVRCEDGRELSFDSGEVTLK